MPPSAARRLAAAAALLLGCGSPGVVDAGHPDAASDAPTAPDSHGADGGCVSRADCTQPYGVCDPARGVCVGCVSGADCASGVCNPDQTCCLAVGCAGLTCGDWDNGCGVSIHCGTCARGSYCSSGACATLSPTYPCGGQACARGSEFCLGTFDTATQTTAHRCYPLPSACSATPTCACITANLQSAVSNADWQNYCSRSSPPVTCVEESADHPEYQGAWFVGCG